MTTKQEAIDQIANYAAIHETTHNEIGQKIFLSIVSELETDLAKYTSQDTLFSRKFDAVSYRQNKDNLSTTRSDLSTVLGLSDNGLFGELTDLSWYHFFNFCLVRFPEQISDILTTAEQNQLNEYMSLYAMYMDLMQLENDTDPFIISPEISAILS